MTGLLQCCRTVVQEKSKLRACLHGPTVSRQNSEHFRTEALLNDLTSKSASAHVSHLISFCLSPVFIVVVIAVIQNDSFN